MALDEDNYEYYGEIDSQPGSFDSDGVGHYEEWCSWSDVDVEKGYYVLFLRMWKAGSFRLILFFGRTRMLLLLPRLSMKWGMRIFLSRRGRAWLETLATGFNDLVDVPDWWSSVATRHMGTSPGLEDTSDSPVPVGVAVSRPDLSDPGLGVMLISSRSHAVLQRGRPLSVPFCRATRVPHRRRDAIPGEVIYQF